MKALWLEDRQLSVRDVDPVRLEGEALVRIDLSGVCGTDLELVRGYYPYTGVLGHEFVGHVVESPDPAWIGKRVVGEINASCGECPTCLAGRPTHCEQRTVLGIVARNGVHAEFASIPLANLFEVPAEVPDDAAVFLEPIAAAVEILQQVSIGSRDRVLLVGAGRLGQLVAQVVATTGASLEVLARHDWQRELLHSRAIDVIEPEAVAPDSYDIVIEATGSASGLDQAIAAVRPRGILVLKSTYADAVTVDLAPVVVNEITVVGSRCGPFGPALELLAQGAVDPTGLIEARYPLTEAVAAMEHAARRGAMKVLIQP
ncbi:MAG TPA: alcohol dehydrogenase catalytic domain-containing protein [Coriobacteriia bacterium]|nr:alcohol dehydrogenase catalytic domain-containing protein [Coriobacteriia bacterium]